MKEKQNREDRKTKVRLLSDAAKKREWREKCRLLWQQIFGDSDSYMEYYEHYKWKENLVLLLCQEDEAVSMLHLNPYDILWEGRKVCLHYIVGVCTKQELRGRGYMGNLLSEALRMMYRRREPWTYLMPAAEELYIPYDFVPVYRTMRYVWEGDKTDAPFAGVMPYQNASDRERRELARFVEGRLSRKFSVFTVHDEAFFEERAAEAAACGGDVLILEQGGSITGYVQYLSEPGDEIPAEVTEMVSETGREHENIVMLSQYLEVEKIGLDETCFWKGTGGNRCVIMARIVCAAEFLRWIKRPPQWDDAVCLEIRDDRIEENNGVWRVLFREEDHQGNLVEKTMQKPDYSYTVRQAAEIFFADMPVYINELV